MSMVSSLEAHCLGWGSEKIEMALKSPIFRGSVWAELEPKSTIWHKMARSDLLFGNMYSWSNYFSLQNTCGMFWWPWHYFWRNIAWAGAPGTSRWRSNCQYFESKHKPILFNEFTAIWVPSRSSERPSSTNKPFKDMSWPSKYTTGKPQWEVIWS